MTCPNCNGAAVSPQGSTAKRVCSNCGLVLSALANIGRLDQVNPEWQSHWRESGPETLKEYLTDLRTVSCQLNLSCFPETEKAANSALIHQILKEYGKDRPPKEIAKELSLSTRQIMKPA